MIPAKQGLDGQAVIRATILLLLSMVAATGATVWLVGEIRKEQRAVQAILHGGSPQARESLGTLPGELRWQFVITILVSCVLLSAAVGLVVVGRAYLTSEASLHEMRMLSAHILSSMNQGVVTTDPEGTITSTNTRAQELLGFPEHSRGQRLADICSPETPLSELSQKVLLTGQTQTDRDYAFTRNGHPNRLRAEGQVLRGDAGRVLGTVLLVRDVTERTLMEERMRRMERFMGLGTVAAGLHHEIKNPLSALLLHVQLLEERLARQMDEEVAEDLSVLKTEVARIVGVLENFGDYASIEQLNPTETDIAALVRHAVSVVRPKADQQHVRIDVQLPDRVEPKIIADRGRLEQVLLNLVFNALDEMSDGGNLSLAVQLKGRELALDVADTGRGIPANIQSRIFDPYFTTKRRGLGMGLALCDKVIREHGGQIDFETSPSGTRFRISLPVSGPTPHRAPGVIQLGMTR